MVNYNLSNNIFNQNFDDPLMNYSLKSIISPVVKKKINDISNQIP